MASNEQVISTLNGLIAISRDGQEGFRVAAEAARGEKLRALFSECSRQRASFAGELQDEVRRLGGEPADSGSVAGSLHRGWMGLKALATGADDDSILEECGRGEDSALAAYRAALDTDMPAAVRAIVERQFAEVKKTHDHINTLEKKA